VSRDESPSYNKCFKTSNRQRAGINKRLCHSNRTVVVYTRHKRLARAPQNAGAAAAAAAALVLLSSNHRRRCTHLSFAAVSKHCVHCPSTANFGFDETPSVLPPPPHSTSMNTCVIVFDSSDLFAGRYKQRISPMSQYTSYAIYKTHGRFQGKNYDYYETTTTTDCYK